MKSLQVFVVVFLTFCCVARSDFIGCNGTANSYPFWTEDPVFVSETTNGKRYLAGDPNKNMSFHISHLYGSPYDMGYATGKLFEVELPNMLKVTIDMINGYLTDWCDKEIHKLEWVCVKLEEIGIVEEVLKLYVDIFTDWYTEKYIKDELRGMSDASGISYKLLLGLNAISDIIKAGCSMVLAWGDATKTGSMMQLRALWLDPGLTMQYAPIVAIYHPDNMPAYALVGYLGDIGLLTGYSQNGVGISEKAWEASKEEDRFGNPWSYVLRDVLMNARTPNEATKILNDAKRTCPIHVGVGFYSGSDNQTDTQGVIYDYQHTDVTAYTDKNCSTYETHPRKSGLLFLDEYIQPDINECYWSILEDRYGTLDAEYFVTTLAPVAQTGGLHTVGMDYEQDVLYISNAQYPLQQGESLKGPEAAFNRQFTKLDMKKQWNIKL